MILLLHEVDDSVPVLLHNGPGLRHQWREPAKLELYPIRNRLQVIIGRGLPEAPVRNLVKLGSGTGEVSFLKRIGT